MPHEAPEEEQQDRNRQPHDRQKRTGLVKPEAGRENASERNGDPYRVAAPPQQRRVSSDEADALARCHVQQRHRFVGADEHSHAVPAPRG